MRVMREIYVRGSTPREIAVAEDGRLVEYLLDEGTDASPETIYLGRVERVVPGMKAAFVDIGQEKNGFLPLEEKSQALELPRLQSGMSVLVQVKKEAQGAKGAFLTRDVTLCGETVILMPLNRYIGVSARISDEGTRKALSALGRSIAGGCFGLVMRAASAQAEESAIREETAALLDAWEDAARRAPAAHAPSMVYRPRTALDSVLCDYRPRGIDRAVTDDPAVAALFEGVCPVAMAGHDLMENSGMARQRDKALERFVWLKSGGSLVIDECEAMTVIDVNTGKFTGKRLLEDTILTINLEACEEIVRQTRLRNLSGIIVADLIDMASQEHRDAVQQALTRAFADDRIKTVIHGFTSLGLMEITRKKTRRTLRQEWSRPCRACHGLGWRAVTEEEEHG